MKQAVILISALLVGFLYIAPPLIIAGHLRALDQPFVLSYTVHRDELFYMGRAREIYDGHFPPSDLFFDEQKPTPLNPLPPLIMAALLALTGGNANAAYLAAIFIFPILIFLLFYWLGTKLFGSFVWVIFFAYVGALTPIALRILNFDGA